MSRHVHISDTTMMFLNGDYDLEPGNGATRDSYLAEKNIKTYLVSPNTRRYKVSSMLTLRKIAI